MIIAHWLSCKIKYLQLNLIQLFYRVYKKYNKAIGWQQLNDASKREKILEENISPFYISDVEFCPIYELYSIFLK